jgi:hypothetical protein
MITQPFRHSNSRYIDADVNDPAAYEERDGKKILKDGYRVRIPVELMDSTLPLQRMGVVPAQRQAAVETPMAIGTSYRNSPLRHIYHRDGTLKSRDRTAVAATAPQKLADAVMSDVMSNASHKPGFRYAATDGTTTDANDAVSAYNTYVQEMNDAWKSPERRTLDARDAVRAAAEPSKPADYVERFPGEWQRQIASDELVAVSNKPSPGSRWGEDEAAVETPPDGAYCKAGVGAKEGDVVTWNGAPARLVKRGDWLFPEVHQQGPTRSGTSSGDAAVGDRSLQDAAYREMVERISNEWRAQG